MAARPMSRRPPGRSLPGMKKRLFITALVLGILVLALGGWTVKGIRRVLTGSAGRRVVVAPARRPATAPRGAWRPAAAYLGPIP